MLDVRSLGPGKRVVAAQLDVSRLFKALPHVEAQRDVLRKIVNGRQTPVGRVRCPEGSIRPRSVPVSDASRASQERPFERAHGIGKGDIKFQALAQCGVDILEGQVLTEHARSIKNDNEVKAMRCAIVACEAAVEEMRDVMQPGISENEMCAALHAGNIKRGGEWIETRILSSGPRTNPWFQECGPRIMQNGDVMAFDTDLVGTYGYCCDISK